MNRGPAARARPTDRPIALPTPPADVEPPTSAGANALISVGESSSVIMDKYARVKTLGKGSFGAAILVTSRADPSEKFVVKEVDVSRMPRDEREAARLEAQLLAALHHPNIVTCHESFTDRGKLCIVMDYCERGDLYQLLKAQVRARRRRRRCACQPAKKKSLLVRSPCASVSNFIANTKLTDASTDQLTKRQRGAPLPERRVVDMFTQLLLGLKHVHDRKVLHR